ncbi:MAG: U32 family peptidase [Bacteroidales bacterium]|nr:U32 family peptidase [Bacteroidales bacterium]
MRRLELLAPARNADIGIAAIDCGADAVYIAAPRFGARQAAGNSIDEIARLCSHAHLFGARIFVTLNTIIYDSELQDAIDTLLAVQEAGADAVIVQDMAFPWMLQHGLPGKEDETPPGKIRIPLHASTQCAIRTPEKARFLEQSGFSRLILEREMSLEQIKEISGSVSCEIEFFVHGALCVCYSGQCYLSEMISGRSANRGACIQACRSRYDLMDRDGNTIARNKSLLSLKDYSLRDRIGDLAEAGVTSFKIEGRLKNISYVKNIVRYYSIALDEFIAKPENAGRFTRASYGLVTGGFTPDPYKTFNRGYTELFLDGKKGSWASMDAAKSMGEELGTVSGLNRSHTGFTIVHPVRKGVHGDRQKGVQAAAPAISNGDGLSFISRSGEVTGVRADVCNGMSVQCKPSPELYNGARIFRNYSIAFEKAMESNPCRRLIDVNISVSAINDYMADRSAQDCQATHCTGCTAVMEATRLGSKATAETASHIEIMAISQDGREARLTIPPGAAAENQERMKSIFKAQLSKTSGIYTFNLDSIPESIVLPHMPASAVNALRRELSAQLDGQPCKAAPLYISRHAVGTGACSNPADGLQGTDCMVLDYKANISNHLAEALFTEAGLAVNESAYELTHRENAELMRSRYCIRHELGLCPRYHHSKDSSPLYLMNNGRQLTLTFDCARCEMTVSG